jgi:hypothetical protein
MNGKFPPLSELTGPCSACGKQTTAPIPLRLRTAAIEDLRQWPNSLISGLYCERCKTSIPLVPVPIVYWQDDWVGLVPDGPRRASYILQMATSWIADEVNGSSAESVLIRVFASIDALSYVLRYPEAGFFSRDVKSRMGRHWDFEVIALTQFADDALRLEEPLIAYGLLSRLVESHSDLFSIKDLRDAMHLVAHACGDEKLSLKSEFTALQHFRRLQSSWDEERPFPELDRFQLREDIPLSIETGKPIEGSFDCIVQDPPDALAVCDVSCRLLGGIELLRHFAAERDQSLDSARTAEAKVVRTLKSRWPELEESAKAVLREWFHRTTEQDLANKYGI